MCTIRKYQRLHYCIITYYRTRQERILVALQQRPICTRDPDPSLALTSPGPYPPLHLLPACGTTTPTHRSRGLEQQLQRSLMQTWSIKNCCYASLSHPLAEEGRRRWTWELERARDRRCRRIQDSESLYGCYYYYYYHHDYPNLSHLNIWWVVYYLLLLEQTRPNQNQSLGIISPKWPFPKLNCFTGLFKNFISKSSEFGKGQWSN